MSKLHFRPGLEHVAAYRAGKPAPVGPNGQSIKLSSNENPYPPLPQVVAGLQQILPANISRYPNLAAPELIAALAAHLGVGEDEIALGAGSVEVAGQLMHALTGPGDEVMFAWRSFEAYPILARVAGAEPVMVPLTADGRHDLPAMAAAVTPRTRVIFVCNPNNPTGTVVSEAELTEFMAAVPNDVLVVIDEAYVHFDVAQDSPSGLDFYRRYPNVAVLHTFSKAYGLAGLRIGYAVAKPEVAEALRKVSLTFGVSQLAQEGARLSLAAEAELQERIDQLIAEREKLVPALRELGYTVHETQANFVWLAAGDAAAGIAASLEAAGISTRCFAGEGIRVTIGTPEENAAVLAVLTACAPTTA